MVALSFTKNAIIKVPPYKYLVKDSDKAICNLKYGISFGDMDIDLFYYDEKKEISSFN